MEMLFALVGMVSLYFFIAIFIPKKLLFFIYDEGKRKRWIAVVLMVVSYSFGLLLHPKEITEKQELEENKQWTNERIEALRRDSVRLANFTEDSIKEIDKQHILAVAGLFSGYTAPDSADSANEQILSLYKNNDNAARALGKKYFRSLRIQYVKMLNNDAWEDNIEVSVSGKNKDVITFVGGLFASHRYIKKFHEQILPHLLIMQFKRANYKWIEHDDKYTFFDL